LQAVLLVEWLARLLAVLVRYLARLLVLPLEEQ
jgi:hypothetical protein